MDAASNKSEAPREDVPQPALAESSAALTQVVDDLSAQQQAADWLISEMLKGRTPEELETELQATGWTPEEASDLVEKVRRHTRRERGVLTRADVVRQADKSYRKSMTGGWFVAFPSLSAAFRLLYALGNFATLGRFRRGAAKPDRDEK